MDILKESSVGVSFTDKARDIFNLAYDDTDDSKVEFEKQIKAAKNDKMLRVAIIAQYKSVARVSFTRKPVYWVDDILKQHGFI